MASSPRFWQKLGIGKQHKSTSSSTQNSENQNQDGTFFRSSTSFCNQKMNDNDEAIISNNNNGKQVKRFSSTLSLRHRASSASLYQLQQQQQFDTEKPSRRISYMKPLKRTEPDNNSKLNETMIAEAPQQQHSIRKMPSNIGSTKLPASTLPTRKQPCMDIFNNDNNNRHTPSRLKKTKSNQSLMSMSTPTSAANRPNAECSSNNNKVTSNSSRLRQPSPAISPSKLLVKSDSNSSLHHLSTINKKKSLPKIPSVVHSSSGNDEDDENMSFLTRTSSNGSTSTDDKNGNRRLIEKGKKSIAAAATAEAVVNDQYGDSFAMDMLKDELAREKASAKALQGQKDAISKDLDYFCNLVDEVTEEKDEYKRNFEEEKNQKQRLQKIIRDLEARASSTSSSMGLRDCSGEAVSYLETELQSLQQHSSKEQYAYYNNLQYKNDEINVLKTELKQAQSQVQVLRKTMEQMLRAEGKDNMDDVEQRKSFMMAEPTGDGKCLLLQTGYHPDHSVTSTSPPSPLPCYNNELQDDDLLSTSSKDSYHSNKSHHQLKLQYELLRYDDDDHQMSFVPKTRSEDFNKKIAMSRRRKDQLEEMLGEVDTQLNKAKQKIRPSP